MVFELDDGLRREILFAMEDQTEQHLLDAGQHRVVARTGGMQADEERLYAVPGWSSADGYAMLESFAQSVRSPLAREELRQALTGGRGVFRSYKNILRSYPLLERKFSLFKDRLMGERVLEWYNALRESWGLEKLSEELEDTEDMFLDDFEFCPYTERRDAQWIARARALLEDEYREQFGSPLGHSVAALHNAALMAANSCGHGTPVGYVCFSQSGDFAGCILWSPVLPEAGKTALITDFFVLRDYRGMGLGTELLSRSLAHAQQCGIRYLLASQTVMSEPAARMLEQAGFERLGSAFVAEPSRF